MLKYWFTGYQIGLLYNFRTDWLIIWISSGWGHKEDGRNYKTTYSLFVLLLRHLTFYNRVPCPCLSLACVVSVATHCPGRSESRRHLWCWVVQWFAQTSSVQVPTLALLNGDFQSETKHLGDPDQWKDILFCTKQFWPIIRVVLFEVHAIANLVIVYVVTWLICRASLNQSEAS